MILTREMEMQMEEEIHTAIVNHGEHIQCNNYETIFTYKKSRGLYIWDIVCCDVCLKPNLLHADPWSEETCSQTAVNIFVKYEYIDRLENDKVLKIIAKRNTPARRTRTPGLGKYQDWYQKEDTPWERDKNSENLEDEYEDVPQIEYKDEDEYKVVTEAEYKKEVEIEDDHEDPESENDCEEDREYNEAEYEEADYEDESEDEYGCDNEVGNEEEDDEVKYYWLNQVDDFIEQNPRFRGYDHRLLRLHPDKLKEFLVDKQEQGMFNPRNLSNNEKGGGKQHENKDKFKHRVDCEEFSEKEMKEGRDGMRQIDDDISQNPSEKDKEEKPPPYLSTSRYSNDSSPFSILATEFFGGGKQQHEQQRWQQQQYQQLVQQQWQYTHLWHQHQQWQQMQQQQQHQQQQWVQQQYQQQLWQQHQHQQQQWSGEQENMSVNTGCKIQNNYPVAFNIPPSPMTPQDEKNIKKNSQRSINTQKLHWIR